MRIKIAARGGVSIRKTSTSKGEHVVPSPVRPQALQRIEWGSAVGSENY